MKKDTEAFVESVSSKEIREVLGRHLSQILKNERKKEVVLMIDKKYAVNELHKSSEIEKLTHAAHKVYGEDYSLSLKANLMEPHNQREALIPHTIRY